MRIFRSWIRIKVLAVTIKIELVRTIFCLTEASKRKYFARARGILSCQRELNYLSLQPIPILNRCAI